MKRCKSSSCLEFNKDLRRNGISLLLIILLGALASVLLPNSKYSGSVLSMIVGVLFILIMALPSYYKHKKLNWVYMTEDKVTYKKLLKFAYQSIFIIGCVFILIGIVSSFFV